MLKTWYFFFFLNHRGLQYTAIKISQKNSIVSNGYLLFAQNKTKILSFVLFAVKFPNLRNFFTFFGIILRKIAHDILMFVISSDYDIESRPICITCYICLIPHFPHLVFSQAIQLAICVSVSRVKLSGMLP